MTRLSDRSAAGRAAGGHPPGRHHAFPGASTPCWVCVVNFLRSIPFIITVGHAFPRDPRRDGHCHRHSLHHLPAGRQRVPLSWPAWWKARWKKWIMALSKPPSPWVPPISRSFSRCCCRNPLPSLVNGAAISVTTILGYTALASAAGGGGLGALAITKGLNVRKFDIMYSASLLLVVLVQIITVFGTRFTRGLDHKKR